MIEFLFSPFINLNMNTLFTYFFISSILLFIIKHFINKFHNIFLLYHIFMHLYKKKEAGPAKYLTHNILEIPYILNGIIYKVYVPIFPISNYETCKYSLLTHSGSLLDISQQKGVPYMVNFEQLGRDKIFITSVNGTNITINEKDSVIPLIPNKKIYNKNIKFTT